MTAATWREPAPSLHNNVDHGAALVSPSTDVIFEILSWLPVKSLCRFMCVSKQWRSLISDQAFIPTHESRAEPLLAGSFHRGASLGLMHMDGNMMRTMDGVDDECSMLCTSVDDHACFADDSPDPHVMDLATGEMLLTRSKSDEQENAARQKFFPACYNFGIGRVAQSHVYKVVRVVRYLFNFHLASQQICDVLTLGDAAGWRRTKPPATRTSLLYHCHFRTSVAISGALHFLVSGENKILCFDLESEEWNKTIEGPWKSTHHILSFRKTVNTIITELNGALCISQTYSHRGGCSNTDIWLLDDPSKEVWTKMYTIQIATVVHLVKPLMLLPNGKKLLFYCMEGTSPPIRGIAPPILQIYDLHDQTCTKMMGTGTSSGFTGSTIALCNLRLGRFVSTSSQFV